MLGVALEGLALVSEGHVQAGLNRLDEAVVAALSGDLADMNSVWTSCCYLIFACERIRDYDRAAQWCNRLKNLCQ